MKNINPHPNNSRIDEWIILLRKTMPQFQEQFSVKSFWLFGSQVRGAQKKQSDLDILVEFTQAPNFFEFIELEDRLSTLLGVKVDLVMKKTLKFHIGRRILCEVISV